MNSGGGGVLGILSGFITVGLFICLFVMLPVSMSNGKKADDYIVDRKHCDCSCWDRKYKGPYYRMQSQYKSFWFNYDYITPIIFAWTYLYLALFHRSIHCLIELASNHLLRYDVAATFALTIFPNFYGYWCVVNYLNDRWHPLLNSQLFFCFSELIIAFTLLLANKKSSSSSPSSSASLLPMIGEETDGDRRCSPRLVLSMLSLAGCVVHILICVREHGSLLLFKRIRDLMFVVADLAAARIIVRHLISDNQFSKPQLWTTICLLIIILLIFYESFCKF